MKPTLILGIGNILLRDEGVGVRAVEAMRHEPLPDGVELLDGGTSGADLIDDVADRARLIVIDAVDADARAGTLFRLGLDDLLARADGPISLHEFGLLETLQAARHLGCAPREVVIFGVQPQQTHPGLDLSETVAAVLPRVIDLALAEARR